MSATVILKSNVGALELKTYLPNGKELKIEFKQKEKEGPFLATVPTLVEYLDDFKTKRVAHENYAQHILNSYDVEIVEIVEKPAVTGPIVQKVEKKKPGRPRKDTQDEEVDL
jgi:hypothetical protein